MTGVNKLRLLLSSLDDPPKNGGFELIFCVKDIRFRLVLYISH